MKQNDKPDQSFNSIANKFEKNIYGSSKGQLRHELLLHYLNNTLSLAKPGLNILDAGGGTGMMTAPLLNMGHKVTLNDLSQDVLELAREKLGHREGLRICQGEIQSIDETESFDLVICHAVLEWLQDPLEVIKKLVAVLRPGGHLSLSFFNKDAHRFGNLLYGNFDYVKADLKHKNTVRLNPNNALVPREVIAGLNSLGLEIIHTAGIRCIHDYLKQPDMQTSRYEEIKQMEMRYGTVEPYLWLGKYFHIIVHKAP